MIKALPYIGSWCLMAIIRMVDRGRERAKSNQPFSYLTPNKQLVLQWAEYWNGIAGTYSTTTEQFIRRKVIRNRFASILSWHYFKPLAFSKELHTLEMHVSLCQVNLVYLQEQFQRLISKTTTCESHVEIVGCLGFLITTFQITSSF